MDDNLTCRIVKFDDRFISREVAYPFDIIVRTGPIIVFIEEGSFTPRVDLSMDFYRKWPYSSNWHIVHIPGHVAAELTCEHHVNANGTVL